jgi:hypothetical protein
VNAGLDPEVIQAGLQLAGYYIEGGARSFSAYSKKMVADLGEAVRPYLKAWYLAIRNYPGFDNAGMQTEAELEALERENELRKPKKEKGVRHAGSRGAGARRSIRPRTVAAQTEKGESRCRYKRGAAAKQ